LVGDTTMSQVSAGFQAGGKAYGQVIFFQDKRALDDFESGSFEFAAWRQRRGGDRKRLGERGHYGRHIRGERREERCHHDERRFYETSTVISLRTPRKIVVAVLGSTILALGIALIVLPGPAVIVIPLGLTILATEFLWARRLLRRVKHGTTRLLGEKKP
jgi:tellurite resistance protein TerC